MYFPVGLPGGSPGRRQSSWAILLLVFIVGLIVASGLFWIIVNIDSYL